MKGKSNDQLAPIAADSIYPLDCFMRRTGLAKSAIRAMRRNGFVVRRIGRRSYVWGRDFQDWVENHAEIIGSTCPV
jgi:hypothetical protein